MRALAPVLVLVSILASAGPAAAYDDEIRDLGARLAAALAGDDLRAVAVRDFTDLEGDVTELGRFLAEEVSSALVAALARAERPGPRVIDRNRLGQVLEEMELQGTGLIPPEELREVGRIAGVDALVTGRITAFSDTLRLRVKVLDSRTGEDLYPDEANLPRTRSLAELEKHSLSVVVRGDCGDLEIDLEGAVPRIVEIDDQEVALLGCVRAGDAVHCVLDVTSQENDRSFHVFGTSRIVLADGTQVPAERVSVGSSTATGAKGRAGDVLVEGVPLGVTASFRPVPRHVERIRLLELLLQGDDVRLHDVPIARR